MTNRIYNPTLNELEDAPVGAVLTVPQRPTPTSKGTAIMFVKNSTYWHHKTGWGLPDCTLNVLCLVPGAHLEYDSPEPEPELEYDKPEPEPEKVKGWVELEGSVFMSASDDHLYVAPKDHIVRAYTPECATALDALIKHLKAHFTSTIPQHVYEIRDLVIRYAKAERGEDEE